MMIRSILMMITSLIVWGSLFLSKPYLVQKKCGIQPDTCTVDQVNSMDRIVFTLNDINADRLSNYVQNLSGAVVFLTLLFLTRKQRFIGLWVWAQISLLNLALMETVRSVVQRPRPLVYFNPTFDGMNPHQYNSFYSGHTSFVSLSTFFLAFMVLEYFPGPSRRKTLAFTFSIIVAAILSMGTGVLRVLGGRHYPSDVIVGMILGVLLAFLGVKIHQKFDHASTLSPAPPHA